MHLMKLTTLLVLQVVVNLQEVVHGQNLQQTKVDFYSTTKQTSPLIYTFASNSPGGANASWGTRMKSVSDYFKNGGTNQISSSDIVKSLPSGTVTDERWRRLGLGATDAEKQMQTLMTLL